jgi:hypothetical protein
VKYTVIKFNLYLIVHSIELKFEKIWLSHTSNITRKPVLCLCPVLPVSLNCPFLIALSIFSNFYYIPARREFGVYRDPHVRPSIRHTFGFGIIIQVPLNQVFSNFHTLLCTIKIQEDTHSVTHRL